MPLPNADSIYYLFHLRYSDNNYSLTDLLYTVINSKGNGGRGEVQAVFSPNGRKFALAHSAQSVTVFDFDRCTGLLSNPYDIRLWPPVVSGRGLAISPSSRYLYVSNIVDLYQYDLYAADISLSVLHIDTYDGFMPPLHTTFYQQKLAPDGKIYMTANNGVDVLHVIHQPDSAGVACQFE
ncbi:MAG: hypothetical protein KF852_04590 [Saprospiraceae bacterium]|nr:hypothetical protein [Saprospiraceae bacterium]